jgi:hypothetical protein
VVTEALAYLLYSAPIDAQLPDEFWLGCDPFDRLVFMIDEDTLLLV